MLIIYIHREAKYNMKNKYINIYNIFLRSVESGRALYAAIERAKYMGFDTIYFNPCFKTGKSQSIYSIADYYGFDPLSFDEGEVPEHQIKDVIALCSSYGLCPVMDLVINHTAIDSELIDSNPDFYCYENGKVKLASGRDTAQRIMWYDLAQLNYNNIQSGLWDYMLNVCKYYISLGFRGFRCDAADQVSLAFWVWLIREIKKTESDILFIGEAYLCSTNTRIGLAYAGFDYVYNSSKWWDYRSDWLIHEYNSTCRYFPSISFPDNHDTCRLMEEIGHDTRGFLQRIYFSAFWSQGFQITAGTEFGATKQLNCITTRRSCKEMEQYDFTEHIKEMIKMRAYLFAGNDGNEPQQVLFKEDTVLILKNTFGFIMDFRKSEFALREFLPDHNNVFTFNCRDAMPDVKGEMLQGDSFSI